MQFIVYFIPAITVSMTYISFFNHLDVSIMSGKRLKVARVESDLTQAELAEKVGCTRQTIGLIEADRFNPSLRLCLALARALGRTLDDLFWTEEVSHEN
jgi:putative transcriptional regulator